MKSLPNIILGGFWCLFSYYKDISDAPRAAVPKPTQFQIGFAIRRMRLDDRYLPSGELASKRNQAILDKYQEGYTLMELAEMFQISYQRIHQIVRQGQQ